MSKKQFFYIFFNKQVWRFHNPLGVQLVFQVNISLENQQKCLNGRKLTKKKQTFMSNYQLSLINLLFLSFYSQSYRAHLHTLKKYCHYCDQYMLAHRWRQNAVKKKS